MHVALLFEGGILFLVNNTEYPNATSFGTLPTIIEDSVSVVKTSEKLFKISSGGTGITVRDEKNHLIVTIVLSDDLFGKTRGLLGNWSGNTDDDWLLPNGTILSPPLTDEQIHFDFGEKCKFFRCKNNFMFSRMWYVLKGICVNYTCMQPVFLTQVWSRVMMANFKCAFSFLGRLTDFNSLFVNTTADIGFFCPDNYMPIFVNNFTFPNITFQMRAQEVCQGNRECLFDMAATLSEEFGETTKNNSATLENDNEVIGKRLYIA